MGTAQTFDPAAFEYAMRRITDGNVFERFGQDLFCQILGYEFVPLGGLHDRGIDGLDRCFNVTADKTIYQFSIEENSASKIRKTLAALKTNTVECGRLFYVTNRTVPDQDILQDKMFSEFGVTVNVRDLAWLRGNVNRTEGTLRTYLTFIETHYHEFSRPGASPIVADLDGDPRLYVFLRQQFDSSQRDQKLDSSIADSLILYALEGTDPERKTFRSRDEIKQRIDHMGVSSNLIAKTLDTRLGILSMKPRKINFHAEVSGYCLPYQTRLELDQKNLADAALFQAFRDGTDRRLGQHLEKLGIAIASPGDIVDQVIRRIFKQQGLEFSQFMNNSEGASSIDKSLSEIISDAIEDSSVVLKNRPAAKSALLATIRELLYYGSADELEYLRRLANTYLILFLMQCDPKVATYFSTMASKMHVLVDNSVIVPAISEFPLEQRHRRHWNLLTGANRAGVHLYVDQSTLSELASHVRRARQIYQDSYVGREGLFDSRAAVACVDEILIRSYLYSRIEGKKWTFDGFLDQFVSPDLQNSEEELATWLQGTFGLDLLVADVTLDQGDVDKLKRQLAQVKKSSYQAENDAKTILTVYALRSKNRERAESGIFGFKTWWLSKDTLTHKSVETCFGKRFEPSCYMRPDFLYNYIALAASYDDANRVFDVMFPSLLGVNVSHHIPSDVGAAVNAAVRDHGVREPARVRALLRTLGERLRTEPTAKGGELRHFLDEELRALK